MEKLYTLYDFIRNSETLQGVLAEAGAYILKAGFVFALLNCFFGYRLRKIWSCFFGLLLGVGAGLAAGFFLDFPHEISLAAAALGGLLCMALAFLLYRIGMFFLCIGAVILTLFQLFPLPTFSTICGFVIFGITMGFLAVIQEHRIVICITAVCGGVGSAKLLLLMLSNSSTVFLILLSLVFSALGLLFQFKPWKDKDYWEKEEERSAEKRKREKERRSSHASRRNSGGSRKHGAPSGRRQSRTAKTASSPGTAHTASRSRAPYPENARPKFDDYSRGPAPSRPQTPPAVPSQTSGGSFAGEESYTVDLSRIRSEISREVQDIYQANSPERECITPAPQPDALSETEGRDD